VWKFREKMMKNLDYSVIKGYLWNNHTLGGVRKKHGQGRTENLILVSSHDSQVDLSEKDKTIQVTLIGHRRNIYRKI